MRMSVLELSTLVVPHQAYAEETLIIKKGKNEDPLTCPVYPFALTPLPLRSISYYIPNQFYINILSPLFFCLKRAISANLKAQPHTHKIYFRKHTLEETIAVTPHSRSPSFL